MIQADFGADVVKRLRDARIVPVITIDDPANAVPLARALAAGGLRCVEITFRTAAAAESIERISGEVSEMFVGAGTVLTPSQAAAARSAGARFIVAPGFGPRVVEHCQTNGIPVFPGIATPTEIDVADSRKVFDSCDLNGDGFIDTAEFHLLLAQLDGDVTSAECQLNFEAADTEGDGYIGFKEFVAWWTN